MKKILIFLIFLLSQYSYSFAQTSKGKSNVFLDLGKIDYTPPLGYFEIKENIAFQRTSNNKTNVMFSILKNVDKNIVIGICAIPHFKLSELTVKIINDFYGKRVDPNASYLNRMRMEADSAINSPVLLKNDDLKRINADKGYIYPLRMDNLFLEKYSRCRILIIHKEDVSDAQVFFFYNEENEKIIFKEIEKQLDMLRFKIE